MAAPTHLTDQEVSTLREIMAVMIRCNHGGLGNWVDDLIRRHTEPTTCYQRAPFHGLRVVCIMPQGHDGRHHWQAPTRDREVWWV